MLSKKYVSRLMRDNPSWRLYEPYNIYQSDSHSDSLFCLVFFLNTKICIFHLLFKCIYLKSKKIKDVCDKELNF